jgi:hypothetical protein
MKSALLIALLLPCFTFAGPGSELEEYLRQWFAEDSGLTSFRIGVIADPHTSPTGTGTANSSMRSAFTAFRDVGCRLVLVVGDLGTPDTFKVIMDEYPELKVAVAMGNHEIQDNWNQGKRDWITTLYPQAVINSWEGNGNHQEVNYSFDIGGLHIVHLEVFKARDLRPQETFGHDNAGYDTPTGQYYGQGYLTDSTRQWLRMDLENNRGKRTILMQHTPLVMLGWDNPYYLLDNRVYLFELFKEFPEIRWDFSGHLHDFELLRFQGISVGRVNTGGSQRTILDVNADTILVGHYDGIYVTEFTEYASEVWTNMDSIIASQIQTAGGMHIFRIAEDTIIGTDRVDSDPRGGWVTAENSITPTNGPEMLKFSKTMTGCAGGNCFFKYANFLHYGDVWITEGMKLKYDIYAYNSVTDHAGIHVDIRDSAGDPVPGIVDQNGLDLNPAGPYNVYTSLQGMADSAWYSREFDLGPFAGGYIGEIEFAVGNPSDNPYPAGEFTFYVDNIRLEWPADVSRDVVRSRDHGSGKIRMNVSPNPFNKVTVITIMRPMEERWSPIEIRIYDMHGRKLNEFYSAAEIHIKRNSPAAQKFTWNSQDLPSGIYLVKARTGGRTLCGRVMLVK